MSRAQRRALVERETRTLPIAQQCRLLAVSRASVYRKPAEVSAEDLAIMALIDRQYLVRPYYGSRRMAVWLATQGHVVNRKRVRRLMRLLGLVAIYQRPNTSKSAEAHKIYPYLLGGMAIERVNQVWCADVTYIPMPKGFLYLVVIMDWVSRAVLAWRLSNTLGPDFCVEALEEALARDGRPEIFNTDGRPELSGWPVHQRRLHRHTAAPRDHDQHGWQGPVHGQHLRRATVAQPEIRRGIPQRLCDGGRGQGRHWRVARLLQHRAPSPKPRLPHAARDLRGRPVDMWTIGFADRLRFPRFPSELGKRGNARLRPHTHCDRRSPGKENGNVA
jgi:putative transposase